MSTRDVLDFIAIMTGFLTLSSPVVIATWVVLVRRPEAKRKEFEDAHQNQISGLRTDVELYRQQRDGEIEQRRKDKANLEDLAKKYDDLQEERRQTWEEHDKKIEGFEAQLAEKDKELTDLQVQLNSAFSLKEAEVNQREILTQKVGELQTARDSLQSQIESMVKEFSTVRAKDQKAMEKMNSIMEKKLNDLKTQVDANHDEAERERRRVENARRFLLQIPGLAETQVEDILAGKAIWEDVQTTVLEAVKLHDTGKLDPAKLPLELQSAPEPQVATEPQPAVESSSVTAQPSADVNEPTEVPNVDL